MSNPNRQDFPEYWTDYHDTIASNELASQVDWEDQPQTSQESIDPQDNYFLYGD